VVGNGCSAEDLSPSSLIEAMEKGDFYAYAQELT